MINRLSYQKHYIPEKVKTYEDQGYVICNNPEILDACIDQDHYSI